MFVFVVGLLCLFVDDVSFLSQRAATPRMVDEINGNYVAYFIALAVVLAAAGTFFGVLGE